MKETYFDIGVNLSNSQLLSKIDYILAENTMHHIEGMIAIGCNVDESKQCIALASQYAPIYATAGVHPHHADHLTPDSIDELLSLIQNTHVVAVGETGLDFNRNYSTKPNQLSAFQTQIEMAIEVNKTLYVHQRDAHSDVLSLLKQYRSKLNNIVIHCFTDTEEALRAYIDLDCYIGITGWVCDERKGQALQQILQYIPSNRLLLETDAPFLLPRTLKPKPKKSTNFPFYLPEIAKVVSALRQESIEMLTLTTTQNAYNCFNIPIKRNE